MNIFQTRTGALILIYLYENEVKYLHKLARKLDITYSHASKLMVQFVVEGIVNKKRIGRRYDLELTEKGKFVAKRLKEIREVLDGKQGKY